jgi:hypothetical protein
MAQCPSSNLSFTQIETLARQRPGTVFLVPKPEFVTPPDTRTRLQKLYKSAPKRAEVKVLKPGTYLGLQSVGYSAYDQAMLFQLETGRYYHDVDLRTPDACTGVGLATPTGGRKRRSGIKKQTRRAQRKRRNTVRH